ncbi:MAG: hypothetical protein V1775_18860 [Bacteroidota bacterium]
MDDLQKYADQAMHEINNKPKAEFMGYSPMEMHNLLYEPFGKYSPVMFHDPGEVYYKTIPVLNQVRFLANLIEQAGELKLTDLGYLPPQVVIRIYEQGFLRDKYIESGFLKLRKEMDFPEIGLSRILLLLSGLVKKRNNKLSLTASAKKVLDNNPMLLRKLFEVYCLKFNWAYLDLYGDNNIGQFGFGFSLVLLDKFGDEQRNTRFYAGKYFQAFPALTVNLHPRYFKDEQWSCYSLRTFQRFLTYFGLTIETADDHKPRTDRIVQKSPLFNRLIQCNPHRVFDSGLSL